MEKRFDNYILKCNFDLYYFDDIVNYLKENESKILSFFGIDKLNNPCTIEIMNWEDFEKFQIEKTGGVKEYKCGDTDINTNSIRVLLLEDQRIHTTHKNATLEDTLNTVLHEFVHICHANVQKYDRSLIWFFEGIATNLVDKNYEMPDLSECDFNKLVNDFKNFGKGSYKYSYTIVKYILNNYSKEEIFRLLHDSEYLLENANKIFEEVKNRRKDNRMLEGNMLKDKNIKKYIKFDLEENRLDYGDSGYIYDFNSIEEKNIFLPFQLYVPNNMCGKKDLLVTVRTPKVSFDEFNKALEDSKYNNKDGRIYLSLDACVKEIAIKEKCPILLPVIPRCPGLDTFYMGYKMHHNDFEKAKEFYNIGFSKFSDDDLLKFKNLDKQIYNMIKYSIEVFQSNGYDINEKVVMSGYSSSSKLVNFFTMLHPDIVKIIFAGGIGGLLILPITELNGWNFEYPIGIKNEIVDLDTFKRINQFYYIAEKDVNDPVEPKIKYLKNEKGSPIKDEKGNKIPLKDENDSIIYDLDENGMYKFKDDNGSYTDYQVNAIINNFGFDVVKRFEINEKIYKENNINCVFKKYHGDHFTIWNDERLKKDAYEFYNRYNKKNDGF